MKPLRLFIHLVKFHVLSVPWYLWAFLLGISVFMVWLQWKLTGDTSLSTGDNLFALIYFFIFAAQLSWGVGGVAAGNAQTWANGSRDFLWTRAVDRGVLFWSKLAVFGAVCSLVWISTSAPRMFCTQPVKVSLYGGPQDKAFEQALLNTPTLAAHVEEAATPKKAREVIALDRGNVVLAGLGAWKVTAISLLILWLVGGLRLTWRWLLGVFFAFLLGWLAIGLLPALLSVTFGGSGRGNTAWLEAMGYRNQVLMYAQASLWWWLGLGVVGLGIVMDTRRRYRPSA
jgi:hypothetical protein